MTKLKTIRIEDFRGIKHVLDLPFEKGGSHTSLAIYGKNGTGKSSIVDAWEWLCYDKIQHLAREGAGERDYPHRDSDGSTSYIELEFDNELGNIKFEYDQSRITQPIVTGNFDDFKSKVPHPCHLRYGDLQRFVYFTKAGKYEYLAKYLGFETALLIQNNLRTYQNTLQEKINIAHSIFSESSSLIGEILGEGTDVTEKNVICYLNNICKKHNIPTIDNIKEIQHTKDTLKKIVDENPKTKELAGWKELAKKVERFYPITSVKSDLQRLEVLFEDLKNNKESLTNIIRIVLYEGGLDVLSEEADKSICPLCDLRFEGDLVGHITKKHQSLQTLKKKFDEFQERQSTVQELLRVYTVKISNLDEFESEKVREVAMDFFEKLDKIKAAIPEPIETLSKKIFDLEELEYSEAGWVKWIDETIEYEEESKKKIEENKERLDMDRARKELTDDYTNVNELANSFSHCELNEQKLKYLNNLKSVYDNIVSSYNEWIKEQIQAAVDNISENIVNYFNLLEDNHPYIKKPKINLYTDRDKAIELEIEFAGEGLSPAYKVLSESQINSFGLAVFLASVKHFNTEFKFIILDDVINSFDAYKRPRVIQLLHQHFNDYQLMVLTHDKIWYEWLIKKFPTWNRLRFYGWDYITGPKVQVGKDIFEQIEEDIEKDEAVDAGQKFGRYLEWILQIINQDLQTPIKFRIDNEYTLAELFDPFKKRIRDKLRNNHNAYKKLEEFETTTIFRNFCMHWKGTEFMSDEIDSIYKAWREIEEMLYCIECHSFGVYDNTTSDVKCRCGKNDLKDEKYYEEIILPQSDGSDG